MTDVWRRFARAWLVAFIALASMNSGCYRPQTTPRRPAPPDSPLTQEQDDELEGLLPGTWTEDMLLFADGTSERRDGTDNVWQIGKLGGLEWRRFMGQDDVLICALRRRGRMLDVSCPFRDELLTRERLLVMSYYIEKWDDTSLTVLSIKDDVSYRLRKR